MQRFGLARLGGPPIDLIQIRRDPPIFTAEAAREDGSGAHYTVVGAEINSLLHSWEITIMKRPTFDGVEGKEVIKDVFRPITVPSGSTLKAQVESILSNHYEISWSFWSGLRKKYPNLRPIHRSKRDR